jgi:murein DD-endopeptidase MepM/ murein hydrolase activator NlpD
VFRKLLIVVLLFAATMGRADTLYKYKDAEGNWIFSDRPPADGSPVETRDLERGGAEPEFVVQHIDDERGLSFVATNAYHAPFEIMLHFERIIGLELPPVDLELRWVVPARSRATLLTLERLVGSTVPEANYFYEYVAGNSAAKHAPEQPYRTPYAVAQSFPVSQAYPDAATHQTPDSAHAVDFALPIGTGVFAARGGIVFDVEGANYRGGLDTSRHGASPNVVQILHDDGTFAVYAHLRRSSIRVRPGDRVRRGDYIAESGNTGFSTGPHLHFVVLRNAGMSLVSVPVSFEGQRGRAVAPASGKVLTAYR